MAATTNIGWGKISDVPESDWESKSSNIRQVRYDKYFVDPSERFYMRTAMLYCNMIDLSTGSYPTITYSKSDVGYYPKQSPIIVLFNLLFMGAVGFILTSSINTVSIQVRPLVQGSSIAVAPILHITWIGIS